MTQTGLTSDLINVINALEKWCTKNGIELHRKVRLGNDPQSGIGVFSRNVFIQSQMTLVKIPKISVLSARSCSLAGVIPYAPYGLAAQLSLSLALYVEILKGLDSRWYGYLQSFPQGIVDLPLFWDVQMGTNGTTGGNLGALTGITCLRGTEAGKIRDKRLGNGRTTLDEVTHFYYDVAEPTLLQYSRVWCNGAEDTPANPTLLGFYRAFSAVSSRAFLVDSYHGLAMVPIADAFNHVLENHVHLESDYNVCPECGSLNECTHDRDDPISGTHNPSDDANDLFYEMVSNTAIPPNTEIFNTYGEDLSNAQLLNQYGFILDVNENDRVSWSILEIQALCPGPSSDVLALDLQAAMAQLPENTFSDSQLVYHEPASENIFCLSADGTVSHALWALLFTIATRELGLGNNAPELIPAVLAMQFAIENENEDMDNEDGDPICNNTSALHTLLAMARLVVRLCAARKAASGPEGLTAEQLADAMDMELPEENQEGRRIQLALALLIGEHSILDACVAAWTALIESATRLLHG